MFWEWRILVCKTNHSLIPRNIKSMLWKSYLYYIKQNVTTPKRVGPHAYQICTFWKRLHRSSNIYVGPNKCWNYLEIHHAFNSKNKTKTTYRLIEPYHTCTPMMGFYTQLWRMQTLGLVSWFYLRQVKITDKYIQILHHTQRYIFFLTPKKMASLLLKAQSPSPLREGRRELYKGMDIIPFMGTRGLFLFYFILFFFSPDKCRDLPWNK